MVQSTHRRKRRILYVMLPIVVFTSALVSNFLSMFLEPMSARSVVGVGTSTLKKNGDTIDVYIPGAGFSGFFYTLGRLQALHQSSYHNSSSFQYYCFSAGCLALLTSLLQLPVDSAIKLAHSSRNRWILGEISRYDVVEHFVDGLLDVEDVDVDAPIPTEGIWNATIEQDVECRDFQCNSTQGGRVIENEQFAVKRDEIDIRDFFPRINVITSTWDAQHFISQQVQQPSSVEHLKELLIQTTWIPFVTGSSFWKREGDNFHNDGAFAGLFKRQQFFYPGQYHHSLLLPWSVDLLSNGLNILLGHDRAVHYWEEGYSRGVNAS